MSVLTFLITSCTCTYLVLCVHSKLHYARHAFAKVKNRSQTLAPYFEILSHTGAGIFYFIETNCKIHPDYTSKVYILRGCP